MIPPPMRFALLPMKPLAMAKTRLAAGLGDSARAAVSLAMYTDVLEALLRARFVEKVLVVSADRRLLDIGASSGAIVVDEGTPRGLNGAVALGTERAIAEGAASVLVVLSDLPFVTAEDVDSLYRDLPPPPHVRLVRSHEGLGTNAILRSPPGVVSTRFGGRSYQDHRAAAVDAGIPFSEIEAPGLSFDVDTMDDLQELTLMSRRTHTYFEAQKIGLIPARLS